MSSLISAKGDPRTAGLTGRWPLSVALDRIFDDVLNDERDQIAVAIRLHGSNRQAGVFAAQTMVRFPFFRSARHSRSFPGATRA